MSVSVQLTDVAFDSSETEAPDNEIVDHASYEPPAELQFVVTEEIERSVGSASERIDRWVQSKNAGRLKKLESKTKKWSAFQLIESYFSQCRLAADLEMDVVHFKSYGKNFIKSQRLSPDSYIQMAIQYAFYK